MAETNEIGVKLSVKGGLVICRNALHGSFDPFDALQYAPGPILHKVLFSGARIKESDKVGSRSAHHYRHARRGRRCYTPSRVNKLFRSRA